MKNRMVKGTGSRRHTHMVKQQHRICSSAKRAKSVRIFDIVLFYISHFFLDFLFTTGERAFFFSLLLRFRSSSVFYMYVCRVCRSYIFLSDIFSYMLCIRYESFSSFFLFAHVYASFAQTSAYNTRIAISIPIYNMFLLLFFFPPSPRSLFVGSCICIGCACVEKDFFSSCFVMFFLLCSISWMPW